VTGGLLGADLVLAVARFLARPDVQFRRGVGVPYAVKLGRPGSDRVVCGSATEVAAAISHYLQILPM
jgi:hypothetical protein